LIDCRLPNMADNNGTNVMEAIGGETRSPPQGSLKRHVYCTTGDSDFLSMEKALQVTELWVATDPKPKNPAKTNIVFQNPRMWLKQETRVGWRLVSCTKVVTFLCFKRNNKWMARNVGMTYACFHCDKEEVCKYGKQNLMYFFTLLGSLDEKLTAESQEDGLLELLKGTKRSSDSSKGYEFLKPPKDLWKPMHDVWNRDKNPFESKKDDKKNKKETNPNMKLKKLLDDLK